jgi:hypothetical protein
MQNPELLEESQATGGEPHIKARNLPCTPGVGGKAATLPSRMPVGRAPQ